MNLQETIKESLGCMDCNSDQNAFTREYNNIYSIFSNTRAEVVCDECNLMIIRGSEFRKCTSTLMDEWFYKHIGTEQSVAILLEKYKYMLLDCDGENFLTLHPIDNSEDTKYLNPELMSMITQKIKDCDFVIVTSADNLL